MAADPYKYFRVEARELVDQLAKGVLELEKGEASVETIARLLRLAHTLKGAARVVKRVEIAELAHAIEDVLAPLRDGGAVAPRAAIDALLGQLDRISAGVDALAAPTEPGAPPPRPPADEAMRAVRVDVDEMDAFVDAFAEATMQLGTLRTSGGVLEEVVHVAGQLALQLARARANRAALPASVDVLAAHLAARLVDVHREMRGSTERLGRELGELREAADRLRLVPASTLFAPLERVARDAAHTLGRSVRVETSGGDVRLESHVLTALQPALVQLVRNAIAHGIEAAGERRAAGKPAEGLVRLDVVRRGNRIAFSCIDDGRGIDLLAVRSLVQRRGLAPDASQTDEQLLALLMRGGLTTSGQVTELSGRGVGLDVVRDAATRLGGELHAQTVRGRGTTFELVVPVTMASLEGLLVEAAGVAAVIPLDAVRRTSRVKGEEIVSTSTGRTLLEDGEVIAFFPLAAVLDAEDTRRSPTRPWSTVVVAHGGQRAAIGVDRLLGTATVLQRPLPPLAPVSDVVAGLALDDAGDPRIVLDPVALLAAATRAQPRPIASDTDTTARILVIDDSLTTRMLEQAILESAGYDVELAVSAEDGLARAHEHRFALFLVDVEMPGMDGFTFVERTRADPALRDVPAILVTSRDAPQDRERGRLAGAAAYVVKGEFDQSSLLRTIAKLIGGA